MESCNRDEREGEDVSLNIAHRTLMALTNLEEEQMGADASAEGCTVGEEVLSFHAKVMKQRDHE